MRRLSFASGHRRATYQRHRGGERRHDQNRTSASTRSALVLMLTSPYADAARVSPPVGVNSGTAWRGMRLQVIHP